MKVVQMKKAAQKESKRLLRIKNRKLSNLHEKRQWIKKIKRERKEVVIHLKVNNHSLVVKVNKRKRRLNIENLVHHHQNHLQRNDHDHYLVQVLKRKRKRTKSIKLSKWKLIHLYKKN